MSEISKVKIAVMGGGPAGMFIIKRLVESGRKDFEITIFEKAARLGAGMPYSRLGANTEHVTNVSANEIPELKTGVAQWVQDISDDVLNVYQIDKRKFNEYKVLPRLLFGDYLEAQFDLLLEAAKRLGIVINVRLENEVVDVIYQEELQEVWVEAIGGNGKSCLEKFNFGVICTGHQWPQKDELLTERYFDSPYPPAKLEITCDHAVAIRGSSLTAIDAVRTLARYNGTFTKIDDGKLRYETNQSNPNFKLIIHSRNGSLPAVRFHLEDSHLFNSSLLTEAEIAAHIASNGGFLSLDYLFENDFKKLLRNHDPDFYETIRKMRIEEFVAEMMRIRETLDPFVLFKAEYVQAERSIKNHKSIYWKEMLAVLSFAMNYPAKYLSAEDMLRLQKVLMPLISVVIAFVPQKSAEELMALHEAGVLEIVAVGNESDVLPQKDGGIIYRYFDDADAEHRVHFKTFVDCIGQKHLNYADVPFKSLLEDEVLSPARLRFKSKDAGRHELQSGNDAVTADAQGNLTLNVPGIAINDVFQVIDHLGQSNHCIYMMAVPYIGGFNPDYSGLDFCEAASKKIVGALLIDVDKN